MLMTAVKKFPHSGIRRDFSFTNGVLTIYWGWHGSWCWDTWSGIDRDRQMMNRQTNRKMRY